MHVLGNAQNWLIHLKSCMHIKINWFAKHISPNWIIHIYEM